MICKLEGFEHIAANYVSLTYSPFGSLCLVVFTNQLYMKETCIRYHSAVVNDFIINDLHLHYVYCLMMTPMKIHSKLK